MKYVGILSVVFIIVGCSSTPSSNHDVAQARSPASIIAKFGLECVANAELFRTYSGVSSTSESGDAELAAGLGGLTGEARDRATVRALAEAYAYGQNLLQVYESYLDKGYTHDRIMRWTPVYAELHALYFLRHDLERFASAQIAASIMNRLEDEPPGDQARGLALLEAASRASIVKWKSYLEELGAKSEFGTLALAEVENQVFDMNFVASTCRGGARGFSAAIDEVSGHQIRVITAAKSVSNDSAAYRLFQPKSGESGVNVANLVRARSKGIRREWASFATRGPQGAPPGKVIYPDAGKAGNIFGTNFPKGVWALTFDDGPHGGTKSDESYTKKVLANLKHHGMKATFFVLSQQIERADCPGIGPRLVTTRTKGGGVSQRRVDIAASRPGEVFPELALAERDQGHAVASHSYYHSQVPKDNDAEQDCEIKLAARVLAEKLGYRPAFFRLPYGAGVGVPRVRAKIAAEDMVHVYWSVDTLDWQDHDPDSILRRTLKAMKNGGRGVILFHDVHLQSVIASERIMAHLKDPANGLEPVTIPQIVDRLNSREDFGTE